MVDVLVDVDQPDTGLDSDLFPLFVELENPVHVSDIEKNLAIVQRLIAVTASGSPRADLEAVLPAIGQCLAALLGRRGTGDQGAGADRAHQGVDVLPLHEARQSLGCRRHECLPRQAGG